jgi:hypothetical protein
MPDGTMVVKDDFKDLEERGDFFRNMILGFTQVRKPHLI